MKLIKTLIVLGLSAGVVFAGEEDSKDLKKVIEDQAIYVETAQPGVVLSGYVDVSYTYQFAGGTEDGNGNRGEVGNASTENQLRAFDLDHNDFNIHAVKIALEKALPLENTWAAGFRLDLMFGEDAGILNGNGNPGRVGDAASEVFVEQAYAQFRIPVGNGLDIKFGKFVTLLGYEVIESYANLNFSRGLLFQNAIPLTHTGVLAEYTFNDYFDVKFGVVNGWNSSDSNSVGLPGNWAQELGKTLTGAAALHSAGGNATLNFSWIYSFDGDGGAGGAFLEDEPVLALDLWGQWVPKFADDRLLLAFNADWGMANDVSVESVFSPGPGMERDFSEYWYGVALYAKYQFTDLFSLAGRAEWIHTDNNLKFTVPGGNGFGPFNDGFRDGNAYSYTLTANFDIWENLLTRVEYRYDFWDSEGSSIVTRADENNDQHQIAVNLVYTF